MNKKYITSLILAIAFLIGAITTNNNTVRYENTVDNIPKLEGNAETTTLTIENKQSDSGAVTYTYNIKINFKGGAVRYKLGGKEAYLLFDTKGNASIDLSANQSITLYDIPLNTTYTIEQSKNDNYKTLVNDVETTLSQGTTQADSIITFKNESTVTKGNPVTADHIEGFTILLLFSACLITTLRTIKIKKYE